MAMHSVPSTFAFAQLASIVKPFSKAPSRIRQLAGGTHVGENGENSEKQKYKRRETMTKARSRSPRICNRIKEFLQQEKQMRASVW